VKTVFDAIVAEWWSIFMFLFGGAAGGFAVVRRWKIAVETKHARLEARQHEMCEEVNRRHDAIIAKQLDMTASCGRCRDDMLERLTRADAWAREDSQHQWAAVNNLIAKVEQVFQGVARIEGMLEASRDLSKRKPS
jgi:hypothetical protein